MHHGCFLIISEFFCFCHTSVTYCNSLYRCW
ncbi:hypothetical protein ACFOEC_06280 [Undibacterium amnicola]